MTGRRSFRLAQFAREKKLEAAELQALAADYVSQPKGFRSTDLRNRLVEGGAWLAITPVLALAQRTNNWEHAEDQMQRGILALMLAAETYNTSRGASFITHATNWVSPAVMGVLKNSFSVVAHPSGEATYPVDIPLDAPLKDDPDQRTSAFEISDPFGSVIDRLVNMEEELARQKESPKRFTQTQGLLVDFSQMSSQDKERVRRDSGLGVGRFRQALGKLRTEYGVHTLPRLERAPSSGSRIRQIKNCSSSTVLHEPLVALEEDIRFSFIALKKRKGLGIAEVVSRLQDEFSRAGVKRSASSMYTLLHAAKPSLNQKNVPESVVIALHRVYSQAPDVNYLHSDPPFVALREQLETRKLTLSDLSGLSRRGKLDHSYDRVLATYTNLVAGDAFAPIDLVDFALSELVILPLRNEENPQPSRPAFPYKL